VQPPSFWLLSVSVPMAAPSEFLLTDPSAFFENSNMRRWVPTFFALCSLPSAVILQGFILSLYHEGSSGKAFFLKRHHL